MFLRLKVYARANVKAYLKKTANGLIEKAKNISRYSDWFSIAEEKAQLDVMAIQYDVDVDTQEINRLFQQYALEQFGKLSQNIDKASPAATLTVALYLYANERGETEIAFAIAAILMILTLIINLAAGLVGRRLKK